jgi:hypothetical protein
MSFRVDMIIVVRQNLGGGMDWIDLAQGRDQWRALMYTVMNHRVP